MLRAVFQARDPQSQRFFPGKSGWPELGAGRLLDRFSMVEKGLWLRNLPRQRSHFVAGEEFAPWRGVCLTPLTVRLTREVRDSGLRLQPTRQNVRFLKVTLPLQICLRSCNNTEKRIFSFPSGNSAVKLWMAGLVDIFILSSVTLFRLGLSQHVRPGNPSALSPASLCLLQAQK